MTQPLLQLGDLCAELDAPSTSRLCVQGALDYYHYKCDGFDDVGWGCGYRTLQTMCSWICNQKKLDASSKVPTIGEIQRILVECGDKPASFEGSRDWIGCFEASIVIDTLYDVSCKLVHCPAAAAESSGNGLVARIRTDIVQHFERFASPLMMGGDLDSASKGILGLSWTTTNATSPHLLVVDPHWIRSANCCDHQECKQDLIGNKWIAWRNATSEFEGASFYNFCLPQLKATQLVGSN